MNAVISLVHFCEAHGPTVVLSTQTTHNDLQPLSLINFTEHINASFSDQSKTGNGLNDYMGGLSFSSTMSFGTTPYNPLPASYPDPSSILSMNKSTNNTISTSNVPRNENLTTPNPLKINRNLSVTHCNGCTPNFPLPNFAENPNRSYKSQDGENDVIYSTTRYPNHPRLYAALRQACVRSLSCEFCPGREGPVLFGNEKHGYTLSYMFKLRDDRARGSQRFYAISILMTDRLYLIASSTFLIGKFRSLARFLQSRASATSKPDNDRKLKAQSLLVQNTAFQPSPVQSNPNPSILTNRSLTQEPHPSGTSDNFLRRRSSTQKSMRTLEELLALPYLTATLHVSFSLILSAGAKRLNESKQTPWQKWVEPTTVLVDALPISSGFKDRSETQASSPGSTISSSSVSTHPRISHLGQLYHALGRVQFGKLMFNLAIGNQVVIRSSSRGIVKDIINVLQDILPLLCIRKSLYESTYQHIWVSNILGIQRGVAIPDDIDLNGLILLEIDIPNYGSKESLLSLTNFDIIASTYYGMNEPNDQGSLFSGFVSEILSIAQQCDDKYALSPKDPPSVFDYTSLPFPLAKNTISFLTGGQQMSPLRLTSQEVRLKLIALKETWSCKGRMFGQYMQLFREKGKEIDPEANLPDFLKLLKVNQYDLPILRFFATAFKPRPTSYR
ncbi:hypothetical protein K502DRAFT_300784 [Neoconidiobolus thromboides FSU 785]|nr:hypothetical protein K502DRAFT_300784 [Neoconidiobolus thromboides FSU 785]